MKQFTRSMLAYLVPVICFFNAFSAVAEANANPNDQNPIYTTMTSDSHGYWEYLPEGYDTGSDTYPLLLCIHGLGGQGDGSPTQLPLALNGMPGIWMETNSFPGSFTVNGQTFKFIVISPQFTDKPSPGRLNEVLDYIIAHYRVNTNRVYMTGFSLGGAATWSYAASNYGTRLAAIVPAAGPVDIGATGGQVIATANLPVWATHSDEDPIVPVAYTINDVNYVNQPSPPTPAAKQTIFHDDEHDSCAHSTYDPAFREDGLDVYEWMLQCELGGANQPPIADAGIDRSVTLPTSSVTLLGSGSDPEKGVLTYQWSKVSGPAYNRLVSDTTPNVQIYGMTQGTYVFRLTVMDDQGATTFDDATVVVHPAP